MEYDPDKPSVAQVFTYLNMVKVDDPNAEEYAERFDLGRKIDPLDSSKGTWVEVLKKFAGEINEARKANPLPKPRPFWQNQWVCFLFICTKLYL